METRKRKEDKTMRRKLLSLALVDLSFLFQSEAFNPMIALPMMALKEGRGLLLVLMTLLFIDQFRQAISLLSRYLILEKSIADPC